MTLRDLCGLISLAGFAAVALRALRRVLSDDAREALLLIGAVLALVLASAFAPELDAGTEVPVELVGEP